MTVRFVPLASETPGTVARVLRESYADRLEADARWDHEPA